MKRLICYKCGTKLFRVEYQGGDLWLICEKCGRQYLLTLSEFDVGYLDRVSSAVGKD